MNPGKVGMAPQRLTREAARGLVEEVQNETMGFEDLERVLGQGGHGAARVVLGIAERVRASVPSHDRKDRRRDEQRGGDRQPKPADRARGLTIDRGGLVGCYGHFLPHAAVLRCAPTGLISVGELCHQRS